MLTALVCYVVTMGTCSLVTCSSEPEKDPDLLLGEVPSR